MLANPKHELFALERAKGATVDEAYVLAGYKANRGNAARLNANESVQARVAEIQRGAAEKVELSVSGVLMELWRIATADPGELVEHQVGCCRHCWGKAFRRQETIGEYERRLTQWAADAIAQEGMSLETSFPDFDVRGGVGFNATRPPNPGCPECFGQGEGRTVFKDTRKLSPQARALYAGTRVTSAGQQVLLHDKMGALTKVGHHLGMFVDRRINTDVTLEEFLDRLDGDANAEAETPSG